MTDPDDLGEALRPIIESLPAALRPPFLALLEEGAAARYRAWAAQCDDPGLALRLRECAGREHRIAVTVRDLHPGYSTADPQFVAAFAAAAETAGRMLAGRSLDEQLAIQARAERRGAAVWRELAGEAAEPTKRTALLSCAGLEEESAAVLDAARARRGVPPPATSRERQ